MALPQITKQRMFFAKLATFWIPLKIYRRALRGILMMGVGKYLRVLRHERTAVFENELSVAAIMKNEGPYLKEWLDFHILAGVDKFYLYDNDSTDDTTKILAPYIRRGIVEYTYFPGERRQNPAYIDALNRFSDKTKWMAFIDLDEFIVPVHHKNIPEFLQTLPKNFALLVLTWVMYGSSGHKEKPCGMVIENYKYHGDRTRPSGCKSIFNPRLVVRQRNPHINDVAGFIIDENGKKLGRINQTYNPPSCNKIRCNHYITKSYEEYKARCMKGDASNGRDSVIKRWSAEKFNRYDTNDIYDPIMDKWIKRMKSK